MSATADDVSRQTSPPRDYEAEALAAGWKPQNEWVGDTSKWVDAKTWIERGEHHIPILQRDNEALRGQLNAVQQRLAEQERLNKANASALDIIRKENQERSVADVEADLNEVNGQISVARQAEDTRLELDLRDRRDELREQLRELKAKPTVSQSTQPAPNGGLANTPEWTQFVQANPWFEADPMLAAAAVAALQQLIQEGKTAGKSQAEKLSMAAEVVKKRFGVPGNSRRQVANRVEGGDSGAGSSTGGGSGKTYADLPPEVKSSCDKAARSLKFGEGKRFKDENAWRKHYVDTYYS